MRIAPLPPMNSLVVFESAARLLSFTQAASELSVTQGAVSRQIRTLEEYLGNPLFVRHKRSLILTEVGQRYYLEVQATLQQLASSTEQARSYVDDNPITVVTTYAMASFWLLPKYSEFQVAYPDIPLRIIAVDRLADIRNSECDLALFYCRTPPANMAATPLFAERVFPVCSPSYLATLPQLRKPEKLVEGTLLYLDVTESWVSWPEWFRATCQREVQPGRRLVINNYPLLIQAALNGQGVALAWETLVDSYLESGLLVAPCEQQLVTESQFYLLEPQHTTKKPGIERFKHWLQQH